MCVMCMVSSQCVYRQAVAVVVFCPCAGTFVASYIAKQHPQRMRGCVLIDPVCLGMFMPNLIYNFREFSHFPLLLLTVAVRVWELLSSAQLV